MKKMRFSFTMSLLLFSPVLAQQITMMTPELVDLGRVKESEIVEGKIRFINTGDEAFTIRQVKTTCGCTAVNVGKKEHAPGDTALIDFHFNSRVFGMWTVLRLWHRAK